VGTIISALAVVALKRYAVRKEAAAEPAAVPA
jgi:hypothetical protein